MYQDLPGVFSSLIPQMSHIFIPGTGLRTNAVGERSCLLGEVEDPAVLSCR